MVGDVRQNIYTKQNKDNKMIKKGFTLAEVLITLAIIGVIAAISVPSLIQKTNQAELITAWKKEFATISQAANKYAFESGTIPNYTTGNKYITAFQNYVKYIKTCDSTALDGVCWHNANEWYKLNGAAYSSSFNSNTEWGAAIANDGSMWAFQSGTGSCAASPTNYNDVSQRCAGVSIDVNGFKKPNTVGKDIFRVMLFADGTVTPISSDTVSTGTTKINAACDSTTIDTYSEYGWGCSSEYLYKSK